MCGGGSYNSNAFNAKSAIQHRHVSNRFNSKVFYAQLYNLNLLVTSSVAKYLMLSHPTKVFVKCL